MGEYTMSEMVTVRPQQLENIIYSTKQNHCPFSVPPLEKYEAIIGNERIEKLSRIAEGLKGKRILKINATAKGGGVAEMLYSSVPFLNMLGVETEWRIIQGNKEYFECTKTLHNLLQGMRGEFTSAMEQIYFQTLEDCFRDCIADYSPDIVMIHDPQPLGMARFFKKEGQTWLWRIHIDIEEAALDGNLTLWEFVTKWVGLYDAAIFSAAHYVVWHWPFPKFIIPPFIDPLSEKNRELTDNEISGVLSKYGIDPAVPIIAQIGRFDPWKGIDRTVATYRLVKEQMDCQLVLAGGFASDDPEAERILSKLYDDTKDDEGIRILNLPLGDRENNWMEVNALQRSASVIMQPSTKEGFGLVITEALWKGKPVIAANVGAIAYQIRDGYNGYFFTSPEETAELVIHLLKDRQVADIVGERGRNYVRDHFLLPDRVADFLMAIGMTIRNNGASRVPSDSIISFHPWAKLSKWSQSTV
jgi:trehalose synthase